MPDLHFVAGHHFESGKLGSVGQGNEDSKSQKAELSRRDWDELLEKSPADALPPDESTMAELVKLMREPARSRLPVSAMVITFNEEKKIKRCLESLLWADEIVVVDAHSTDRTPEMCRDPEAPWSRKIRFFQRPWDNFRDQRNFALDQTTHEWVFVIDSDEACSPELAQKLQQLLANPGGPPKCCYKVKRKEYFLGKPIHYGIWSPSFQDRFFNKKGIRYVNEVHEYPVYPETPDRIMEPIEHSEEFNPRQFLTKMAKYTAIEAQDRYDKGKRTNAFRLLMAFPAMFLKNYFYYKAYRDGMHGFVISVLEGVSRAVRHVYIWEIQQREKKG